jgi:hypothetical protein
MKLCIKDSALPDIASVDVTSFLVHIKLKLDAYE